MIMFRAFGYRRRLAGQIIGGPRHASFPAVASERVGQVLVSRYFEELMTLAGDLPAGPFGRLPAHRVTPAFRTGRLDAAATAALVLSWLTLLIAVPTPAALSTAQPATVITPETVSPWTGFSM